MAPKIIAAALTLIANVIGGVVILFVMLMAMNGYSESDATWGLLAYGAMTALIIALMSVAAVLLVRMMQRKTTSSVVVVLTAVPVFSIIGILLEIVSGLIGVGVAEFVRVNY